MDCTLGLDPEFGFVKNGELYSADNVPYADGGNFGKDGHSSTAELRPLPSSNVAALVQNVEECLAIGYHTLPEVATADVKWDIFSGRAAYGGHIHIGEMEDLVQGDCLLLQLMVGIPMRGYTYPDGWTARIKNGSYGRWRDIREQPHGLEWRTPGGFWGNKQLLTAYLTACKRMLDVPSPQRREAQAWAQKEMDTLSSEFHSGNVEAFWNCPDCTGAGRVQYWRDLAAALTVEANPFRDAVKELLSVIGTGEGVHVCLKEHWKLAEVTLEQVERRAPLSPRVYIQRRKAGLIEPWSTWAKEKSFKTKHVCTRTDRGEEDR